MYLLFKMHNIVKDWDDFQDMDVDFMEAGLGLLSKKGLWTEELRDFIFPLEKKDPEFLKRYKEYKRGQTGTR